MDEVRPPCRASAATPKGTLSSCRLPLCIKRRETLMARLLLPDAVRYSKQLFFHRQCLLTASTRRDSAILATGGCSIKTILFTASLGIGDHRSDSSWGSISVMLSDLRLRLA